MIDLSSIDILLTTLSLNSSGVFYIYFFISIIVFLFFGWNYFRNKSILSQITDEKKALGKKLKAKEDEVKSLMADNSMRLAFKEEWLAKLKSEIVATADATELRQSLNSLIAQLRLQIDTENKLAGLQEKIGYKNTSFDAKLQELFPDLTKGEREVCALLRLNLSIKEIMIIRNVSSDSVKSMRRRIRKKMNISSDIELESFIQQLV